MNIKKRIFDYTPQPIEKMLLTFTLLIMLSALLFIFFSLLAWQGWVFESFQSSKIYLLIISPILVLSIFFNKSDIFKFPFFIQQHLIDAKLAQDLKELALRSSDAVIIDYKSIETHWWQAKQHALRLKISPHHDAHWFKVNLDHVFNHEYFLNINVELNEQLLGQQVKIYYLARSRQIVQIYQIHPADDLSEVKACINISNNGKIIFQKIPTRLVLDLVKVTQVEALRSEDISGHILKLSTHYGKQYQVSSRNKHFDQLELALAALIEFVDYRKFKQQHAIQHMLISKKHPFLYRNILIIIVIIILIICAIVFKNWGMAIISIVLIYLYDKRIKISKASPFIEEDEFK